jgi:hypothetical protein
MVFGRPRLAKPGCAVIVAAIRTGAEAMTLSSEWDAIHHGNLGRWSSAAYSNAQVKKESGGTSWDRAQLETCAGRVTTKAMMIIHDTKKITQLLSNAPSAGLLSEVSGSIL